MTKLRVWFSEGYLIFACSVLTVQLNFLALVVWRLQICFLEACIFPVGEMPLWISLLGFCCVSHRTALIFPLLVWFSRCLFPHPHALTHSYLLCLFLPASPNTTLSPPALFQDPVQPECGRQASWWTCAHRVVCQHAPEQPLMVSAALAAWLSVERDTVPSLDQRLSRGQSHWCQRCPSGTF